MRKIKLPKRQRKKPRLKTVLLIVLCLIILGGCTVFGINAHVKSVGGSRILTAEDAEALPDVDCILVLGCKVEKNGTPSPMLRDRLSTGVGLYFAGAAPKLLMSGDHGKEDYDEVGAMKEYAINSGVPSSNVFMDHAGFSTYESVYRAKEIFGADKIIIVTQEYHLYRALYIAKALGVEAYGVSSDTRTYAGQWMREVREILARNKDVVKSYFQPFPTYLGEEIPISGDGDLTNE